MSTIVCAEIVGIREEENTHFDTTYNSTNYSVLLFYNDGQVKLVEGSAQQIQPFLKYIKPRSDSAIMSQMLEKMETRLRDDFTMIVNGAVKELLHEIRNPIPMVIGKTKDEAVTIITNAGFKVEMIPVALPHTPGTVIGCTRNSNDDLSVVLRIMYEMPDVIGKPVHQACELLTDAGFEYKLQLKINNQYPNSTVFEAQRDGDALITTLFVSESELDVFLASIGKCECMREIYMHWKETGLGEGYPEITKKLEKYSYLESKYGKSWDFDNQLQALKKEILNSGCASPDQGTDGEE